MAVVSPLAADEWLVVGDEGEQVGELQRQLQHVGCYEGEIDQRYGDVTESGVREFQRASSRPDDGRVDLETWQILEREATFAGYDAHGQPDAAMRDQNVQAKQMSEDGEWWWDGTVWQAVNNHAYDQTVESHAGQPRQLSDDGTWEWDGVEWKAVDHMAGDLPTEGLVDESAQDRPADIARPETAGQAPSIDPSLFPDVREGDSGEWVAYLHSMLTSSGF